MICGMIGFTGVANRQKFFRPSTPHVATHAEYHKRRDQPTELGEGLLNDTIL